MSLFIVTQQSISNAFPRKPKTESKILLKQLENNPLKYSGIKQNPLKPSMVHPVNEYAPKRHMIAKLKVEAVFS
jgi:hypothetical protein